ncbi:efflux RND transporter periplasmic adaptor subunit, partial [Methylonatrum kenyense]|uniref:efflux RND transporter periplasmic adaptor subunit n=1 Tax=Methylonatrum kenyense TaxID=455253 RepID=UPI0020C15B35
MRFLSLFVVLLIGTALGAGALWFYQEELSGTGAEPREREVLYYQHPHNPSIRSDEPRKDEMGMDYIPIYAGEEGRDDDPEVLRINPVVVQNMGVRTAEAMHGPLQRQISTVGFVDVDESAQSHVHLRTEGWIEDLRVRTTGERVEAGQVLFRLYSPALVSAQDELLQTLRRNGNAGPARDRLRALGMTADAISQVEQQGRVLNLVPVTARQDGVVLALNVAEGMFVQPGTEVMTI